MEFPYENMSNIASELINISDANILYSISNIYPFLPLLLELLYGVKYYSDSLCDNVTSENVSNYSFYSSFFVSSSIITFRLNFGVG